jgi:hypothetical protein
MNQAYEKEASISLEIVGKLLGVEARMATLEGTLNSTTTQYSLIENRFQFHNTI